MLCEIEARGREYFCPPSIVVLSVYGISREITFLIFEYIVSPWHRTSEFCAPSALKLVALLQQSHNIGKIVQRPTLRESQLIYKITNVK